MSVEDDVLARLPEVYCTVLRLRRDGLDDEAIATALDFEVEAVGPLIRIAERKLERLQDPAGSEPATI